MGVPNLVWIINESYSQEAGRGGLSWGSKRVSNVHWQLHYICAQSCLTLCDPMLLCSWDSSGKNTEVGCHSLLQGNLPDPEIQPVTLVSPA